jgi:hypothetical protein
LKTLETRIADIEAQISPEPETPWVIYVVHETDSPLEQETIREKAIAEYEHLHGVDVDSNNVGFFKLIVCYTKQHAGETV